MANELEVVVLKDAQGNFYMIPRAGLEKARVPEQYQAELEQMIQEQQAELSDAQLEGVAGGLSGGFSLTLSSQLSSRFSNWSNRYPPKIYP